MLSTYDTINSAGRRIVFGGNHVTAATKSNFRTPLPGALSKFLIFFFIVIGKRGDVSTQIGMCGTRDLVFVFRAYGGEFLYFSAS